MHLELKSSSFKIGWSDYLTPKMDQNQNEVIYDLKEIVYYSRKFRS